VLQVHAQQHSISAEQAHRPLAAREDISAMVHRHSSRWMMCVEVYLASKQSSTYTWVNLTNTADVAC
jgi:hypothetical protein